MSKRKPLDKILAQWESFDRPKDGDIYKHYRAGEYEVVATGFLEDTETPCVVYRSLEGKTVWVRTAKNFLEKVEHNGKQVPRFQRLT